ncbi:hypothetical protein DM45_806 [Burkholderia mallei]|nr:hypothetical protein DM53_1828 [Burkholderia mallei]KOS88224.1 hypothetical protein DM45_806 [Burkholderia mallei]
MAGRGGAKRAAIAAIAMHTAAMKPQAGDRSATLCRITPATNGNRPAIR